MKQLSEEVLPVYRVGSVVTNSAGPRELGSFTRSSAGDKGNPDKAIARRV